MPSDVAIIIPARINSTRLPNKPLVKIGNKTLIEHVIDNIAPIANNNLYVATDSEEIANIVHCSKAIPIMTDKDCSTGSDRILQAFEKIPNNDKTKYIINVQGDMPFVNVSIINKIIKALKEGSSKIITPVVKIGKAIANSPSNVKVVIDNNGKAMYFSRHLIPYNSSEFLYHVGIYGFTRDALYDFVNAPHGKLEKLEKLEQLRALENNITLGTILSDEIPISVDTAEDLEKAIEYYKKNLLI